MDPSNEQLVRKMKQKFLREQISADEAEAFSNCLAQRKPNGDDINNWTLNDLTKEVIRFKSSKASEPSIQLSMIEEPSKVSSLQSLPAQPKGETLEVNFDFFPSEAKRADKERVSVRSIDSKKHAVSLQLSGKEAPVVRNLSDLVWLRNKLQIEFPFCYIPPVKSADNHSEFIQNFFDRLHDMKLCGQSTTLEQFFNDGVFSLISHEEPKNIGPSMVEALDSNFAALRPTVDKNITTYDHYFAELLSTYNKSSSLEELNPLLKPLETLSEANAKRFSQMKHLSKDFASSLGKASEALKSIAKLYEEYIKESESTWSQIGLKIEKSHLDLLRSVKTGFSEWGNLLNEQKQICTKHLVNFFHFKKHESLTISNLFKDNFEGQEELKKKSAKLEAEKKKLFAAKNVAKWNLETAAIKEDINEIIGDYSKVRKYILPQETASISKMEEVRVYLNKQLLFEYINFTLNDRHYLEENLAELGEQLISSLEGDNLIWNAFSHQNVDVSTLDREGAAVLKV